MRQKTTGALLALLATVGAIAAVAAGSATSAVKDPIIIGWAFDGKGQMAPFDGPALAAAQVRVKQLNARGGVNGRKLVIQSCDTNNNNPAKAKACAASLIGKGADIMFVTCDVEFSAPATQEAINAGILAVAPCIGTDQMGPKRFGAKGRLAFSFGNVAQDEGSAMAEVAWSRGWRSAALATNTLLVYFKNVVQAFEARFKQLGGKIVAKESYATGANNVQNAVTRLNGVESDVIVTATAFGELPALVTGLRTLGNNTPILNSWAGDGVYWLPKEPAISNYYAVTYASAFGDDKNAAVNALAKAVKAGTGGFVTGAAAIDGVVTAIKRAKGSTQGIALAAQLEKFRKVPTISGLVSFSPQLHSVYGRQYRILRIQNSKPKIIGYVTAKVVPKI
jgi:branched-chain amino acid transport system substrate-binding protein